MRNYDQSFIHTQTHTCERAFELAFAVVEKDMRGNARKVLCIHSAICAISCCPG